MGSVWLNGRVAGYPNLADVLRAGGVTVVEYPGSKSRSRSTGGFTNLMGIVVHHTASNTTPDRDLNYMVNGPDNPISNGLLDRTGTFTIIACGASNHAGKGGGSLGGGGKPWVTTRGTVPPDSGNSHAFGIEAANNGIGEPWPLAQQNAYVLMCRALCDGYGLSAARDIRSHQEWTPPRKCDPTGPSRFAVPVGCGRGCHSADLWDMAVFRAEVGYVAPITLEPLEPPEGDDDMLATPYLAQVHRREGFAPIFYCDGIPMQYRWVQTVADLKGLKAFLAQRGLSPEPVWLEAAEENRLGVLIGPDPG